MSGELRITSREAEIFASKLTILFVYLKLWRTIGFRHYSFLVEETKNPHNEGVCDDEDSKIGSEYQLLHLSTVLRNVRTQSVTAQENLLME
jgi:hypothetical protein